MITIRPGEERGKADLGWLRSRHTFSFADYYDAKFTGVSDLRVMNDDWVTGGAGFGAHPHRNMEIISYVLEGAIAHKDTMGTHSELRAGEVQVMSAGSGVLHSEFNASKTEPLKFLQIWIMPDQENGEPSYDQRDFSSYQGITLVVSPDGRDQSPKIRQDARIYQVKLNGESASFSANADRVYYLQVARGAVDINGKSLSAGDGATIQGESSIEIAAEGQVDALLMDLRGR